MSVRYTQEQYQELVKGLARRDANNRTFKPMPSTVEPVKPAVKKPKMSKTEAEYERTYLREVPHKFESVTFRMANGCRYTPDFYCPKDHMFIEIKGSYRLGSHGRSMLALKQCAVEFPEYQWRLAIKQKDGGWSISCL